jgi:hypothetical protein
MDKLGPMARASRTPLVLAAISGHDDGDVSSAKSH